MDIFVKDVLKGFLKEFREDGFQKEAVKYFAKESSQGFLGNPC